MQADPAYLQDWVEFLALEIGRRPAARPDLLERAADGIVRELASLGYDVRRQPVPTRRGSLSNIIASPPGSTDHAGPLLVMGAHYDTVSRSPGADDNASGVAGLLAIARMLRHDPPSGIRLAAFCPEEPPAFRTRRMGSYVYASSLQENHCRVIGMICLEMIGYFTDAPKSQSYPLPFMNLLYPGQGDFIAMVGNVRSAGWTKRISRAFRAGTDLPVETLNAPSIMVGIDFSDHWSFNRHGCQAAMVTDTAFYRNPHYHRPSDLPSTLDYTRMARVVAGLTAAARKLA